MGAAEDPRAPSDLTCSKQHLTFPALKEYDSREADRENGERSKVGWGWVGGGAGEVSKRQKPHKVQAATKTVSLQSTSVIPPVGTV